MLHLSSGRKSKVRGKRQFMVWRERRPAQSAEYRDGLKSRRCIQKVLPPAANRKSALLLRYEVGKMRATAHSADDWLSLKIVTAM